MSSEKEAITVGIILEHEDGIVRAQKWLRGCVTIQVGDEDIRLDNVEETHDIDNAVKVELIGNEITFDSCQEEEQEQETSAEIFHEESIRHIMVPVLEANTEYRFPFSIYAPGSVAPSMEYKVDPIGDKGIHCCIEYLLTASFQSYTATEKIEMMGQPLSSKLHPATVEPSVVPVVTSSLSWKKMEPTKHRHRRQQTPTQEARHHGCLVWAAHLGNTHVGKGQNAIFSFSLRNNSSYDVVKLSAKLVEKISWKTETDTLCHVNELGYALMPNLAFLKHQKATLSRHQSQIVSVDHILDEEMHNELALQENAVVMKIPEKCRDSYKGKLIQITHHLLIEARSANTHGQDHSAVMTLELPLKVFNPPVSNGMHHHHLHEFDARSPAELAEKVATKWPEDAGANADKDLQASFTSIDDTSWDASEAAIFNPQIGEEL